MGFDIKTTKFPIKVRGEITEEEFAGEFEVRPYLPHVLQLEEDRLRREYLGSVGVPSPRATNAAAIFAALQTRVVKAPQWFSENGGGMGLYDDNVVAAVYQKTMEAEKKFLEDLKARAEAARKALETGT